MIHRDVPPLHSRRRLLLLAVVVGLLVGVAVAVPLLAGRGTRHEVADRQDLSPPRVVLQTAPSSSVSASPQVSLPPLPPTPGPVAASATPEPVAVSIPSLGVDSALDPLGLLPDGTMAPPPQYGVAGWFTGGTRPGDVGPAVIVGHIDSYRGPGVFYRLDAVRPGAEVIVTRADGSVVRFVVESVATYPKDQFPTDVVYAQTATPELKLITCTGSFDGKARSYRDNLVVDAVPAP